MNHKPTSMLKLLVDWSLGRVDHPKPAAEPLPSRPQGNPDCPHKNWEIRGHDPFGTFTCLDCGANPYLSSKIIAQAARRGANE